MKSVNLNIRINKEVRDKFRETAKNKAQNPSALIRMWIEDYIKENKKD